MNSKFCLRLGAFSAFIAVSMGAFGAHLLKETLLTNGTLDTWNKAVFFHFVHSMALLWLSGRPRFPASIATCLALGILLFSGSLYFFAATKLRIFGMIAPLGGSSFLIGWAWLGCSADVNSS